MEHYWRHVTSLALSLLFERFFLLFYSKPKRASDRDSNTSKRGQVKMAPTARNKVGGVVRDQVGGVTSRSWVWRIFKVALPFQLALVALFCAACLLEPHCCEATNTFNLSFTPQLRYIRGPPPV